MKYLVTAIVLACLTLPSFSQEKKPNIIVVLTDDQGYRDVSSYGCIDFKTPHTDKLAASGVRFTQGYVTHPYCSPSRAGLLSGRYQQTFSHESNPPYQLKDNKIGIPPTIHLLPTALKKAGYTTGGFGKWHLGAGEPFQPQNRGFDHYWGFLGGGHYYFRAGKDPNNSYNSPVWIDGKFTDTKVNYMTDDITDATLKFIDKNKDKPFFAYVSYNAPHSPNEAKKADLEAMAHIKHPERRTYAAMLKNVDDNLGRILQKLDQLKLRENTLIVYLSDNGGRRRPSDNRPLRGNKGWLSEGGIRVPFIVSMPGKIPAGITSEQPVSSLDIFPTALALAETKVKHTVNGENLLHLLEQKSPQPRTLYWRVAGGKGWAIRSGDWKIYKPCAVEKPQLYNLKVDPEERHDLATKNPEQVERLQALYQAWNQTLVPPFCDDGHGKNATESYNSTPTHRIYKDAWWYKYQPAKESN